MAGKDGGGRLLALGGLAAATTGGFLGRHLAFGLGAGASHAEPITHLTALGWHDLCRIYELPDGRLTRRRLGYLTLTMVRLGGDVLALADQCAHLGGPLHQGSLTEDGNGPCVTCPWHGSTFRLADGTVVHGPAIRAPARLRHRVVEGGMVHALPRPARALNPARTPLGSARALNPARTPLGSARALNPARTDSGPPRPGPAQACGSASALAA